MINFLSFSTKNKLLSLFAGGWFKGHFTVEGQVIDFIQIII